MKDCMMLDIESLSTSPKAAVVQVGIVYFDPVSGERGVGKQWNILPDHNLYDVDDSTIKFWMKRDVKTVRSVLFSGGMSVLEFCASFGKEVAGVEEIWCSAPVLDIGALENMFEVENAKIPWKYNAGRCLRTFKAIKQREGKSHRGMKYSREFENHTAMDDCCRQIEEYKFLANFRHEK